MADIEVQTPQGSINAVLEVPAGAGPWPGVVVIHDGLGLSDDIRNIMRRIADNGYLVVAPNLYARGGPARCVKTLFRDMMARNGRTVDDILAARKVLTDRDDCTGKVGVAGFCLGGGFALVMSAKGFDASAPFYPSILPMYDKIVEGACPIVASFGRRDPINIGNGARLRKTLERKGIEHDVKVYDGVGHSFANEMPGQAFARIAGFGYDADAADDALGRMFGFFEGHLS